MKYLLIFFFLLIPNVRAQSDVRCSQLSGNIYQLEWYGVPGRSYFIQASTDNILTWDYLPDIRFGQGNILRLGFEKVVDELYLRLVYTDEFTTNPDVADFDNDGWTNLEEVLIYGTSPFVFNAAGPGPGNGSNNGQNTVGLPLAQFELEVRKIDDGTELPSVSWRLDAGFNILSQNGTLLQGGVPSISVSRSSDVVTMIKLTDLTGENWGAILNFLQLQTNVIQGSPDPPKIVMIDAQTLEIPNVTPELIGPPSPFVLLTMVGDLNPQAAESLTDWLLKPMDITTVFGIGPVDTDGRTILADWLELERKTDPLADEGLEGESFNVGNIWGYRGLSRLQPPLLEQVEKFYAIEVTDTSDSLNRALQSRERTVVFDGHANYGIGPNFKKTHVKTLADFTSYGGISTVIPTAARGIAGQMLTLDPNGYYPANGPGDPGDHANDRYTEEGWSYLVFDPAEIRGNIDNSVILEDLVPPQGTAHPNIGLKFPNSGALDNETITRQGVDPNFFHYPGHLIVDAPNTEVPANLGYKTFFYNACSSGRYFIENFQHGEFVYTSETVEVSFATRDFVNHTVNGMNVDLIVNAMNAANLGGFNLENEYRSYVFSTN